MNSPSEIRTGPIPPIPLHEYERWKFSGTLAGRPKNLTVFSRGEGPSILLLQELPGINRWLLWFADRLVGRGFRVHIPHLFGPLEKSAEKANLVKILLFRRREFRLFDADRPSPIVECLFQLCDHIRAESDTPGIATIGMSLTGSFAISLMACDSVWAAVSAQPALPARNPQALHMSPADIQFIRGEIDKKGSILAYRFQTDPLCPLARFDALDHAFNDPGQPPRIQVSGASVIPGEGHSVFTHHFNGAANHPTQIAFEEIVNYLQKRLSLIHISEPTRPY